MHPVRHAFNTVCLLYSIEVSGLRSS